MNINKMNINLYTIYHSLLLDLQAHQLHHVPSDRAHHSKFKGLHAHYNTYQSMYKIAGMWGHFDPATSSHPRRLTPQNMVEIDPGIDFLGSVTLPISRRVMTIYH